MHIYTIYRATNTINGKVYIGFDSAWPKRKSEHKGDAKRGLKYKFYNAIRKHGWDNFTWEPIYQSMDYAHTLTIMEPFFIVEHDSLANGYNGNSGGEGGAFGAKWWNNGTTQVHTQIPPDQSFKEGRLKFNNTGAAMGAEVQRGKIWINNGINEMMIHPTENTLIGYTPGRLPSPKRNKPNLSATGTKWWNNGSKQVMSITSPGKDWKQGRIDLTRQAQDRYVPRSCCICNAPIPFSYKNRMSCSPECSTYRRKQISAKPRKRTKL